MNALHDASAAPRRDGGPFEVGRTGAQQVYLLHYIMARYCEGRRTRYRGRIAIIIVYRNRAAICLLIFIVRDMNVVCFCPGRRSRRRRGSSDISKYRFPILRNSCRTRIVRERDSGSSWDSQNFVGFNFFFFGISFQQWNILLSIPKFASSLLTVFR